MQSLINQESIRRLCPVLSYLDRQGGGDKPLVIALDGRCASGKTTVAQVLAQKLQGSVIHMDDFFLPAELRTEERLSVPGGNVHYERFREEVLGRLSGRGDFTYRSFDCSKMELGEERLVKGADLYIVEGAYSTHPALGNYMQLKIFSDVEREVQFQRIRERGGEGALKAFKERWIPMEEAYFAAYRIRETSDIVI